MNTNADPVESAGVDAHELEGALPVVGAIPGLAKGNTSIKLASGLRKQPLQSLRRWGPRHTARQDMAAWVESLLQGEARQVSTNQVLASTSGQNEEKMRTQARLATARSVTRGHLVHLRGSTEQPLGIQEGWTLGSESSIRKGLLRPTRTMWGESMPTTRQDASEQVRRWYYPQQKQPCTCIHAPSSHPIVEELGPFCLEVHTEGAGLS